MGMGFGFWQNMRQEMGFATCPHPYRDSIKSCFRFEEKVTFPKGFQRPSWLKTKIVCLDLLYIIGVFILHFTHFRSFAAVLPFICQAIVFFIHELFDYLLKPGSSC